MAPPVVYEQPHEQLLRLAVAARERGLSFEVFWREALNVGGDIVYVTDENPPPGAVRWPTDGRERIPWRRSMLETRETWRRAYEGEPPTRREHAVRLLAEEIGLVRRAQTPDRMDALAAA